MIKYKLFSAGGNITALVKNASQNPDLSVLAKQILQKEPTVEQVGFIFASSGNKENFYLKMMGGELCINAARSAAFDYCKQNKTNRTKFKISGTNSIIKANLKNDEIELSLPKSLIISNRQVKKGYLVNMKGIRFIVADATNLNKSPRKIIKNYDDNKIPAIGLILFNEIGKNKIKINPWVWVKNTNTLIHETACGAGSVAAAYIFSKKMKKEGKKKRLMVVQPSGAIYKIDLGKKQIQLYGTITKV